MSTLKNFLTISRANILLGTFPHAALGSLLASNEFIDIRDWSILAYIILYFTLILYACNINCLCDINIDKLYKKNLSAASESLGAKKIKIILTLELLLICFLVYYLYIHNHLITSALALLGLGFATIYSLPPLRLKAKGILSPLAVIVGLYTLPILGGWFLIENNVSVYFIIFVIGYAFMNEGFTLVNTCEDYHEDKKTGIKTWAHIFGLKNTLKLALIFSIAGYACILSLILKSFILISFSNFKIILVISLLCLSAITISISVLDVWKASRVSDLESAAKMYAKKMPKWFMITRYPLMLSALLILL